VDGFEVCWRIKARKHARPAKVLMITTRHMLESRSIGRAFGADDYFVKPYHPGELAARVASMLAEAP
jgi:two-component system OmpR family response regulator